MPLQFWITLVLALGMMETTVLFAQYLKWNDYGSLSIGVTFVALLCGVLKVRETSKCFGIGLTVALAIGYHPVLINLLLSHMFLFYLSNLPSHYFQFLYFFPSFFMIACCVPCGCIISNLGVRGRETNTGVTNGKSVINWI